MGCTNQSRTRPRLAIVDRQKEELQLRTALITGSLAKMANT